jgi:hypothetical protein
MGLLMKDQAIAYRLLTVTFGSGESRSFCVTISAPNKTADGEYCCEVFSDDVLFRGRRKAFGVDSIDALDYAIQTLDTEIMEFKVGTISWPDGTSYKRVFSSRKMAWGP